MFVLVGGLGLAGFCYSGLNHLRGLGLTVLGLQRLGFEGLFRRGFGLRFEGFKFKQLGCEVQGLIKIAIGHTFGVMDP